MMMCQGASGSPTFSPLSAEHAPAKAGRRAARSEKARKPLAPPGVLMSPYRSAILGYCLPDAHEPLVEYAVRRRAAPKIASAARRRLDRPTPGPYYADW